MEGAIENIRDCWEVICPKCFTIIQLEGDFFEKFKIQCPACNNAFCLKEVVENELVVWK